LELCNNPFYQSHLTTRSEDRASYFLQHIAKEIFGNGLITGDEQFTRRDLNSSSQEKLLEKSVKFQVAKISLNKLVSAASTVATFLPLGVLEEEKETKIANPVTIANVYSDSCYIGRTVRHQKLWNRRFLVIRV